ncbi:MAG: ATP-binding protein [Campylobacterales bacterium]
MNLLSKRIMIPALVALMGLGVVAYYLFFQGFLAQQRFERLTTQTLSDLRLANLELDTLFVGGFSYIDYDKSVKDLQHFEQTLEALLQQYNQLGDDGDGLGLLGEALQRDFTAKSRIVERYKAINAVQNNSLRYLHELYQQLPLKLLGEGAQENAVRLEMGRFLAGISAANLREIGNGGWTKDRLEQLRLPPGHPAEETVALFLLHAKMFVDGAKSVEALGRDNAALGLAAKINKAAEQTDRYFRQRQAVWMLLGNLAFAMGALFFVAFVLVFIREEQLKKRLERMNRELESRVNEETAKRRHQEQMLIQQSKLAAMGEMIGAIAHQWRQPLNTLAINIQDLEDAYNYGELDKTYIQNLIARCMGLIKHMSQTINDFRNFFRQSKEKSRFDVYAAVRETLELVQDQYKNHQISVVLSCEPFELSAYKPQGGGIVELSGCEPGAFVSEGYLNEFKQAVLNLLSNAKDAILERREQEPGRTQGTVAVIFTRQGGSIEVGIEDDGSGVPPELMERIFEPYFSTKEEGKGTGIGLYMAKTILEVNMGGALEVSNGAQGARFVIRLAGAQPSDPAK